MITSKKLNICIIDDSHLIQTALALLIQRIVKVKNIYKYSDGFYLLKNLKYIKPDIIFLDISMPLVDGILTTKIIKKTHPEIKIIAYTFYDDEFKFTGMINAGADAYILKSSDLKDITSAIENVMNGKKYISDDLLKVADDWLLRNSKASHLN